MKQKIIDVADRPPLNETLPLAFQHLFAMFGGTVLVPFLFKVNPSTSLLMNGVGTLIYLVVARGKIPAYLGSSFAFISPVFAILAASNLNGYASAQGAFIAFGIFFILISYLIKFTGSAWIENIFPPAAMGAVVAIIGLELAPVAAKMAGFSADFDESGIAQDTTMIISSATLAATILFSTIFRGFFAAIPVLAGVLFGGLVAQFFGVIDWSSVQAAPWFALPTFYAPSFSLSAMIIIFPAALVCFVEHIGHLVVTGDIIGKDLLKNPGLDRSLLGDGISNVLSGLVGATPNTTYGENIGVMAITRVFSVWVIAAAAILAILISFIGKFTALIRAIPVPVMGGISILLFGVIAATGIRMLIEKRVDYSKPRNLIFTSVILVSGVSGAHIFIGALEVKGMALGTFISICLALSFKFLDYCKLSNEEA